MNQTTLLAGRYELTSPLGRGGMGQVWEAVDRQLERRVAVKLLTNDVLAGRAERHDLVRRFAREAAVTAGLQHPGVPAVYDAGSYDGGLFLVMELIEGYTVGDLIAEQGPLPIAWAAAIAAQVAAVLAVAHERSLVHRDIKPQNLMLSGDGTAKVLDFGVATLLESAGVPRITRTGESVGTPAYMAPEQLRSEPSNARTDLYALGCVLYEMLAGKPVFDATSQAALSYKHLEQAPQPLERADVPAELEWLVRQLLAKEPVQRPSGAREVYDRLLPFVQRSRPLGDVDASVSPPGGMHLYSRVLVRLAGSEAAAGVSTPEPYAAANVTSTPSSLQPTRADGIRTRPQPAGAYPSGPRPYSTPFGQQPSDPQSRQVLVPQRSTGWKLLHSWWLLPTVLLGFFSWVSFFYIGARHQRLSWAIIGAGYLVAAVGLFATIGTIPNDQSPQNWVGMAYLVVLWVGGFIHAVVLNDTRLKLRALQAYGAPADARPGPWVIKPVEPLSHPGPYR
jgi:serine/threonine protein kinase